jgi:hypothetical protein
MNRSALLIAVAGLLAVSAGFRSSADSSTGLQPLKFRPLPLGSVKPAGWLKNQLRIQADGLSGHLDEFWPDIKDSGWIGGKAEGWERAPYWLDGVVPLAYLIDDPGLKTKVQRYMDYALTHQAEDGWLGPEKSATGKYQARDPWPVFVMLKALTQYEEATADPRVVPAFKPVEACRSDAETRLFPSLPPDSGLGGVRLVVGKRAGEGHQEGPASDESERRTVRNGKPRMAGDDRGFVDP